MPEARSHVSEEGRSPLEAAEEKRMALTRSFKELVQKRVAHEPGFGEALLQEAIEALLAGDVDTAKAVLRDYIKATVGFEKLGAETGTQPKSLIRMLGPRGNPQARNLFNVIGYLQRQAGVRLRVTAVR
jgi:DNA-binding phage protein